MFDRDFLEAMPHRAQLRPLASVDQYGRRTFGEPVPVTCYWQGGSQSTEQPEGQVASRAGHLFCAPAKYWTPPFDREPSTDDGLILPDGNPATIVKVEEYPDQDETIGTDVTYG